MSTRAVKPLAVAIAAVLLAGSGAAIAGDPYRSTLPAGSPEAPLLHGDNLPGELSYVVADDQAPSAKTIDGDPSDWVGTSTRFGGTAVYSHGELVYADHIFDAFGADDGKDVDRDAKLDPLNEAAPETYRSEAVYQSDLPGEVGVDTPEQLAAKDHYGDLRMVDQADISEVRVGATDTAVQLLVRTTTMTAAKRPAALVLIDADGAAPAATARTVPFGAGISTATAEFAALLAPDGSSRVVDLATGETASVDAAVNDATWDNAIEASLPRSLFGPGVVRLAVATGPYDATTGLFADVKSEDGAVDLPNLANVAFRTDEPVRIYWDKQQAFALTAGSIDRFIYAVDTPRLLSGGTDTFSTGPGYYDRIFRSTDQVATEGGEGGILQHYGVWVPTAYQAGTANAATFWMHWRGGKAHSAATVSPRIMRDLGEYRGNLVFSPRGRGTGSWYEGKGHVDFLQVWDDAMSSFSVDPNRVYLTGHSMGGWASYFLATVYPDRFAATMPVEGTVTQGAYASPIDDKCSQCYIGTDNGATRDLHTYRLLDNLRNTPIAIYQGLIDELVPETGTLLQAKKLQELGYRYRLYQFFNYEHYTHPIMDEWAAGAAYMDTFTRNPNPSTVTYVRDMPFERAVENGPNKDTLVDSDDMQGLDLCFCAAYWMSGLTPVDAVNGVARFEGTTHGYPVTAHTPIPDTDAPARPGQTGPYAVAGQQWLKGATANLSPANGFELTLSGASEVTLDAVRMGLDPSQPIVGKVTTDVPVTVHIGGRDATFGPGTSTIAI
jgi:pimeloyl-ACP methyl ester carboxylesterase